MQGKITLVLFVDRILGGGVFDTARVLGKYDVKYYRCANCGFVWTEHPYWKAEAYSSAITDADIGLIGRNIGFAGNANRLFKICFPDAKSFLDYGGGYGMFVRMMRKLDRAAKSVGRGIYVKIGESLIKAKGGFCEFPPCSARYLDCLRVRNM